MVIIIINQRTRTAIGQKSLLILKHPLPILNFSVSPCMCFIVIIILIFHTHFIRIYI